MTIRQTIESPTAAVHALTDGASAPIRQILDRALSGEVSEAEGVSLFKPVVQMQAVYRTANELRRRTNGDHVSFVVNRNINCAISATWAAGSAALPSAARMRGRMAHPNSGRARAKTWDRGGTEVCIQGGLHPKMEGTYYRDIVRAIKAALPDMHIHAFSPFEIWYGASRPRCPITTSSRT